MAATNRKTIYIVGGGVLLALAIPVALLLMGFLGGLFYYFQGAN